MFFIISQFFTSTIKIIDKVVVYGKEVSQDRTGQAFSLVNRYLSQNQLSIFRIFLFASILLFEAIRFSQSRGNFAKREDGVSDIIIPLLSDLLYCFLFTVSAITSLRYFQTRSIGFFLHILQKTFKTVRMFLLLFLLFWLILSVVCTRLTNALHNSNNTWIYELQKVGKFEIFGEIDDAEKKGISNECEKYENSSFSHLHKMNFDEASCFIRAILIPYLFLAYMFISGILLINLLTAQLTKEYEDLCEKSKYYKDYIKYEYTSKLDSKMLLPPPLSIIYVIARYIPFCYMLEFVKKLDGIEFGANRPVELENDDVRETCKKVVQIVKADNNQMWNDLQEKILEISAKYPVELSNLENIKRELGTVIDRYDVEMRAGTRMATTRMGEIQHDTVQHENADLPLLDQAPIRRTSTFYTASESTPFLSRRTSLNSNRIYDHLGNFDEDLEIFDDERETFDV